MDDTTLLAELAPTAESLLERHLGSAKEWFPHDFVPWERAEHLTRPGGAPEVDDGAIQSALFVNLLTEDNLPYYLDTIDRLFGVSEVWTAWARRWTAEEGRHSIVLRDYITVTGLLDPYELERGRMTQVSGGEVPQPPNALEGFVYVALQELATRISHRNTGVRLRDRHDDDAGFAVMQRVAADENLHHLFYRDLVTASLDIDPSATVLAMEGEIRDFTMPGTGIPDFDARSIDIAAAGIYDFTIHHDHILAPVVLRHWGLEQLEGLDADADAARERLVKRMRATARAGERFRARLAERDEEVPLPA